MKKILTTLAISFCALFVSGITSASPSDDYNNSGSEYKKPNTNKGRNFHNHDDERFDKRKMREERGVKRLQEHKWQEGYILPQHYRSNSYKVEAQQYSLPRPSRNEQWFKINNDYILVDSENNIIQILDR
ncbi:hypothetical protein B9T31_01670 [Acinetobacter sp. ANC 4558]|uniref:RcnB family protein n=1 Tax=Acinetobacter sp. ANC 4558 TaxID=1977876 RepID=UPI000A32F883|nr:RcnB family protein [Acinetobacter sp. ANC 4558]OTG88256.1 hypothetical protein B9T31_01670 [Acinetobacter sp. ANC 4558]